MRLQHINLIPKNTENTTKAEIQSQITSKTTHSVKENANAQAIAASSQIEKKVIHTRSRRSNVTNYFRRRLRGYNDNCNT